MPLVLAKIARNARTQREQASRDPLPHWRVLLLPLMLLAGGCPTVESGKPSVAPAAPLVESNAGQGAEQNRGNLVTKGIPALPADLLRELARYQNTRSAALQDWLGDGLLISTRFGDTTQLHHVAAPLGARRQLTFHDEPVGGARVPPVRQAEGFVFLKDVGGSEFYQLFWQPRQGAGGSGPARMLTDGKSRYIAPIFSPSGRLLAYSTTERNGADWDLHALSLDGERRVLQQGVGGGWTVDDWAEDEARLLISRYISVNESELYELDSHTGERERLLPNVKAAFGRARYGGNGAVYFTSDHLGEFRRLYRLDGTTGALTALTEETPWDVEGMAISRDGGRLAFTVNEEGMSRLVAMRLDTGAFIALPELPAGIVSGLRFHPNGDRLAFTMRSATTPSDVFSIDFNTRVLTRWTRSELGDLPRDALVAPELVRYPSFDGLSIPAFVYRPRTPGPHPVVVAIHGGPEGQARPGFSPTTQFHVNNLGVAVIAPNVRGSRGYGKTYLTLDNGRKREDSVRDIGALLDWIAQAPDLDASRVAVSGGSYGGYMVLASLVHFGDRLVAGVDRVGISNFVTFLTNTQPYRQDLRRAEYGDERDPAMRVFLESISPLTRADEITSPLLVAQGLNDPRVPASESEQLIDALEVHGVPAWYVLAKDEGHGFRKKPNRDYLTAVTALFLKRHLLGEQP